MSQVHNPINVSWFSTRVGTNFFVLTLTNLLAELLI